MNLIQLNKKDPFDKNAEDREKLLMISKAGGLTILNSACSIAQALAELISSDGAESLDKSLLDRIILKDKHWTNFRLIGEYAHSFRGQDFASVDEFLESCETMQPNEMTNFQQILETYGWQVTFAKLTQFLEAGLYRQEVISAYRWLSENLNNIKE